MLGQVQAVVTQWKRPHGLLSSTATVPAFVASSSDLGSSNTRASSARLFAGHRSLEWLRACFASIQQLSVRAMHTHILLLWGNTIKLLLDFCYCHACFAKHKACCRASCHRATSCGSSSILKLGRGSQLPQYQANIT